MKSRNPVNPIAIEQGQGWSAKRGGALDEPFRQRRAVEKRKCRRCVEFDVHRRVALSLNWVHKLVVNGSSNFGGNGGHGVHHGGTEPKRVGDARRERACSTELQLGAPRVARWDCERSADLKHHVDRARACDPSTSRNLTPAHRPACAQHRNPLRASPTGSSSVSS